MWQYVNLCIVAFAVTFFLIPAIKPIACFVGLVDRPGGRKKHLGEVPLTGGISIFFGLAICVFFEIIPSSVFTRLLVVGSGLMVFVGALDDRLNISAAPRLFAQAMIALIFVYGLEIKINDLGCFGDSCVELPGSIGALMSMIAVIAVINAFNMFDGIDGLVGTLATIGFAGLAIVSYIAGFAEILSICVSLIASIFAFLIFNIYGSVERKSFSKAFMGDAGSMFLGLILAVLLLDVTSKSEAVNVNTPAVLWFVLLPLTDMATTIYRRVKAGRSPLSPDRTHVHHILSRAGLSKYQVLFFLSLVQLMLVVVGIVSVIIGMSDYLNYVFVILFVCLYQYSIYKCWKMVRWVRKSLGFQNVFNRV